MKKVKGSFIYIIFLISLFLVPSKSTYDVTIGTVVQYDNIHSIWDLELEGNHSSGTGFQWNDTNYPNGTAVTVNVTDVQALNIYFNESIGSVNISRTMSQLGFDLSIGLMCFYPQIYGSSLYPWN